SIIAAHEVGHAICGKVHGDRRKVEEISLFAHGEALGVTVSSQEDNDLPAESDLRARLVALMGGRAAEELLFHEVTGGASNDFDKANEIATRMVTRWGMGSDPEATDGGLSGRGQLGFLVHGQEGLPGSPNSWPAGADQLPAPNVDALFARHARPRAPLLTRPRAPPARRPADDPGGSARPPSVSPSASLVSVGVAFAVWPPATSMRLRHGCLHP